MKKFKNTLSIIGISTLLLTGCRGHDLQNKQSSRNELKSYLIRHSENGKVSDIVCKINDSILIEIRFNDDGFTSELFYTGSQSRVNVFFNEANEVDYLFLTNNMKTSPILEYKNWGPERHLRFFKPVPDTLAHDFKLVPKNHEAIRSGNYAMISPELKWTDKGAIKEINVFKNGFIDSSIDWTLKERRLYDDRLNIIHSDSIILKPFSR